MVKMPHFVGLVCEFHAIFRVRWPMAFDAGTGISGFRPRTPSHVDLSRPTPLERVHSPSSRCSSAQITRRSWRFGTTFAALGFGPARDGSLSLMFVVLVSLADTLLLLALIVMLLLLRGESPRELLFGATLDPGAKRAGMTLAPRCARPGAS